MRMRRRVLLLLVVALAGGAFAAQAGAHSAYITEARYCNVPGANAHKVFFTITSWEGVDGAEHDASRRNDDIHVYQGAGAPGHPADPEGQGRFTDANGFFFKGSFTVPRRAANQLRISTKPNLPWGDGKQPKINDEDVVNSAVLTRQRCSGPVKRFVRVNGKLLQCTIVGTRRNDTLTGRRGRDVICGFRGADTLSGARGNDVVVGGSGNDTMLGGSGRDLMVGGGGADEMSGNGGRDRLFGGKGKDKLFGNGKGDRLAGGGRADELTGGSGRDRLIGGRGPDRLAGQAGQDVFRARDGARDRLIGGAGRDRAQTDCGLDIRFQVEVTFSPAC